MKKETYQVINDTMFKLVFKDTRIVVDYINSFLGLNVTEEDIVECNPTIKHNVDNKGTVFDVRVVLRGMNTSFDLEAQKLKPNNYQMDKRLIKYATNQYVDMMRSGEDYSKEIISFVLCFCDFKLENDEPYDEIIFYSPVYNKRYSDIQIKIVSLKEIDKYDNIELKKKLEILVTEDFKSYQDEKGVVGIMAKKMLELNEDEKIRIMAEFEKVSMYNHNCELALERKAGKEEGIEIGLEKGIEQGLEMGLEQGIEIGLEQGKITIAKILKNMNFTLDDIVKATGLSIEQIKEL